MLRKQTPYPSRLTQWSLFPTRHFMSITEWQGVLLCAIIIQGPIWNVAGHPGRRKEIRGVMTGLEIFLPESVTFFLPPSHLPSVVTRGDKAPREKGSVILPGTLKEESQIIGETVRNPDQI